MQVKVSIIVPVYNVEDYLNDCVESLIKQSMKDIEIILVDDGSTDQSGIICDQYAEKDERIRVIHQVNSGQSAARNQGLRCAQGEFILYVDSDDWIVQDTIETLYEAAVSDNCDIVHGDLWNEKNIITNDPSFRQCQYENQAVHCYKFFADSIKNGTYDIVPWLNLVKRTYLVQNQLYFHEGKFYEDQEYTLKLYTAADGQGLIKKIRFPFYYYRERAGSTTTETNSKKVKDIFDIFLSMTAYTKAYQTDNDELRKNMQKVVTMCYYHLGRVHARLPKQSRSEVWHYMKPNLSKRIIGITWPAADHKFKFQNVMYTLLPHITFFVLLKWENRHHEK